MRRLYRKKFLLPSQASLGRDFGGQRYGPRPIDLDLIFQRDAALELPTLQVPHPRWRERAFVKAPLADLAAPAGAGAAADAGLAAMLGGAAELWEREGGELGACLRLCLLVWSLGLPCGRLCWVPVK